MFKSCSHKLDHSSIGIAWKNQDDVKKIVGKINPPFQPQGNSFSKILCQFEF